MDLPRRPDHALIPWDDSDAPAGPRTRLDQVYAANPGYVHVEMMDERTAVAVLLLRDGGSMTLRLYATRGALRLTAEVEQAQPVGPE